MSTRAQDLLDALNRGEVTAVVASEPSQMPYDDLNDKAYEVVSYLGVYDVAYPVKESVDPTIVNTHKFLTSMRFTSGHFVNGLQSGKVAELLVALSRIEQEHARYLATQVDHSKMISTFVYLTAIGHDWYKYYRAFGVTLSRPAVNVHLPNDLKKLAGWTAVSMRHEDADCREQAKMTLDLIARADMNNIEGRCICEEACVQESFDNMDHDLHSH